MKKLLSIILAILMIVTAIPFALAAEEAPDFSDAKAITEENGILYIDGEKAEDDGVTFLLHAGKYKLAENISTSYIWIEGEVVLDLNGYVWDLEDSYIAVNAPFSVYDTSAEENGKITSTFFCTIDTNSEYGVFSLYSGTIENNSVYEDRMAISAMWASANLYGGKVKGNGYALSASSDYNIDKTVVLGDVVLESGEGYAQIKLSLKSYVDGKKINIDVTDYTGESLETDVEAEYAGKFDIIKGVSSADEAEKYKLNIIELYGLFHEKTEYDEEAGDVNIYIAKNAFTQQPSAENCFTVDFNNPAATFQWYEVEEEIIGTYVAESFSNLFTYNFKAGDILKVSTDSDVDLAHLAIGNEYLTLTQTQKSKTIKFNADKTITVSTKMLDIEGIELEFSIIRETALDGETGKALKNPECKKSYCCKATVNGRVYNSDTVVGHEIIQVEEKAATCTETGWEAYGYCTECDYTTYKEIPASHEILQVGAKAPTCTEVGWEAYEYCTACTYTTYVELPENGHTPLEAVKENEVAPKCDVTGSYDLVVYCDDCGAELDRDTKTVDALKHSFTKYEVTEEAKCGVAGKEVAACDNGCGATDEKAIEALKHDIVIDEAVAPKCGETGLTQGEHCTRCDYKVEQEIVPALEHKDADGDYKCDNGCGHEFEKPAPEEPTPDTPDEPTDEVCDHLCHKGGILGFLWKIVQFFSKLFKINPTCECGAAHY